MSSVSFLHISDIHFTSPTNRGDRSAIQKALLAKAQSLSYEFTIMSGDIANKGAAEEYRVATEFFQELQSGKPLYVVPGNHDVDRPRAQIKPLVGGSGSKENFDIFRDDFLKADRFEDFLQFAKPYSFQWDRDEIAVVASAQGSFTLVGINTALLSYRTEDTGNLAVDVSRLDEVLSKYRTESVIAIGHHPFSELVTWNASQMERMLGRRAGGAGLYLCGHLHEPKGESKQSTSGSSLAIVQAGAAYQSSPWKKHFCLLKVDASSTTVDSLLFEYNDDSGEFDEVPAKSKPIVAVWSSKSITSAAPTPSSPVSSPKPPHPSAKDLPDGVDELITRLEDEFLLVLEKERLVHNPTHVFWPVRLRRPTLIHAAQAFIAAALQIRGVSITLCLDDFGNTGASDRSFLERMGKHFSFVGANWSRVKVMHAKDVVTEEQLAVTWNLLADWLSPESANLGDVLAICKLLIRESTVERIQEKLRKKPRKIMTPAVVWSCLDHAFKMGVIQSDEGVLTLGGYDERIFWDAWRRTFDGRYPNKVGHLYGPKLQNISNKPTEPGMEVLLAMADHDSDRALDWKSKEDIVSTLNKDVGEATNPDRVLGWLICQCLLLPSWLTKKKIDLCGVELMAPSELSALGGVARDLVVQDTAAQARTVLLA